MMRCAAVLATAGLVAFGCRGGNEAGGGAAPGGTIGAVEAPLRCPDERVVSTGDRETPEGTLFLAYKAALGPDDDTGFAAFRELWHPDALTSHIRDQIWPRVREHVGKYVSGGGGATFTRCRRVDLDGGRVKVFVKSNDPEKSDPPTILLRRDDGWVIDVMTP